MRWQILCNDEPLLGPYPTLKKAEKMVEGIVADLTAWPTIRAQIKTEYGVSPHPKAWVVTGSNYETGEPIDFIYRIERDSAGA
jgi:hypothetical protein